MTDRITRHSSGDSKKKKRTSLSTGSSCLCWHYLSSRAGQGLSCRNNRPVDGYRQKKPPAIAGGFLCRHYLSSRVGQRIVLPQNTPAECFRQNPKMHKKEPDRSLVLPFVLALPIFPGSHPPSIVGVHELNFCVRDGNRWTLMTINTNYADGFSPSLCQMTFII